MSITSAEASMNHLVDNLPLSEQSRFFAHSKEVELRFGEVLCDAGQQYAAAYFPITGMISLVASIDDEAALELGMIGNEGMLGATLLLGIDESPLRAVVQGQGTALRLPAAALQDILVDCPVLSVRLNRYLFVLMSQLNSTTGCTHFHQVSERLVRWLLMTHDRSPANSLHLTQQFLADMLGVQRSAISIAASALQEKQLISYSRGEIKVLDREGLERAACSCYPAIVETQKRYTSV